MEYEWDDVKAARNLAQHRVGFSAAARALDDPQRLDRLDHRFAYDEERWQTLCMLRGVVFLIVTTMRGDDVCRIISARKATRHEQRRYLEANAPHT